MYIVKYLEGWKEVFCVAKSFPLSWVFPVFSCSIIGYRISEYGAKLILRMILQIWPIIVLDKLANYQYCDIWPHFRRGPRSHWPVPLGVNGTSRNITVLGEGPCMFSKVSLVLWEHEWALSTRSISMPSQGILKIREVPLTALLHISQHFTNKWAHSRQGWDSGRGGRGGAGHLTILISWFWHFYFARTLECHLLSWVSLVCRGARACSGVATLPAPSVSHPSHPTILLRIKFVLMYWGVL